MEFDFTSTFLVGEGVFAFSDYAFGPPVPVPASRLRRGIILKGSVATYAQPQTPAKALLDGQGNPLLDGQGNYLLGG